jgi:hypothetical protein
MLGRLALEAGAGVLMLCVVKPWCGLEIVPRGVKLTQSNKRDPFKI